MNKQELIEAIDELKYYASSIICEDAYQQGYRHGHTAALIRVSNIINGIENQRFPEINQNE